MIDQAYQAELLGYGDDVRRQQNLPVILLHADQALVERSIARTRLHYRLERHHDPALIERSDDFVGDADIDTALGVALDIRPPQRERAGAAALRHVERFMGAVDRLVGAARVARHADDANRRGHRDRAGFGRYHFVANGGQKPLGGDIHIVDRTVLQDQPEFIAGEPAEHVAAAQPRANAFAHFGNYRIGDIEAERVVDARQMIDADQHEGGGRAQARGFLDRLGQRCDQMRAIEFAGQRVVPRQSHELLVTGVAFVVDADNTLDARRLAVGTGEPAAGFLDPEHRRGRRGPHAIFDPVGHALTAARGRRLA